MVMPAADADTLSRVDNTSVEELKWCPGCNHTRTLAHFTPLSIGVPYYRPYCNDCVPFTHHRRLGWFHLLIKTIGASLRNLADRLQTVSGPKKTQYGAESAESRAEWSDYPATGVTTFIRLDDGLLIDMSSPDAMQLLACLQSYKGILKHHDERTPDQQHEIRHSKSGYAYTGSVEPDALVLSVLEPIQRGEQRDTDHLQRVG